MSAGIALVREEALPLAEFLAGPLKASIHGLSGEGCDPRERILATFHKHRQWIWIMATGIAVRFLSGIPSDKKTDPAVVVMDESGRFVISLLSGHEGGANALAYQVSSLIGAVPVITTATEALKPLTLGIGCRKNMSAERIGIAVDMALKKAGHKIIDIRESATIRLKSSEPGLLEWCSTRGIPLRIFDEKDVRARAWVGKSSDWVRQNVGLEGVCEPCALMASPRGYLLVPKFTHDGVAVALVRDEAVCGETKTSP